MNYILYLTTNKINSKVYVGVHRTNPDIFDGYIGCGVTNKDKKKKVIKGFPAAVRKYGYENFERIILQVFPDTEEGEILAYKAEEELVNEEWVKSSDNYNLTIGGKRPPYKNLRKEIAQYTLGGKFIRTWESITEAEEALNLTSISKALNGKAKYCGDFQWRIYTDENDIEPVTKKAKSVFQFDLQGNLIKSWKSLSEAGKQFENPNAARVAITNVCNKTARQAYGYFWSYKNKFEFNPYDGCTAVASYEDDGTFIKSYTSLKDAAEEYNLKTTSNIIACIKGKQKHCGGVRWRYYYGNDEAINPI